ncbi:hypothetical protein ACJRO7_035742 [Eucalyptus globulus]|uniref:Uncharacterized protein n=1 Tax=Eucalyptus globulus TaxID=34317 RepID=A0ABD3J9Q8_EUCGL
MQRLGLKPSPHRQLIILQSFLAFLFLPSIEAVGKNQESRTKNQERTSLLQLRCAPTWYFHFLGSPRSSRVEKMSALPSSFVSGSIKNPPGSFFPGLKSVDRCPMKLSSGNISLNSRFHGKVKLTMRRNAFTVQATRDDGRPSSAGIFVGGFVLGGLIVGALGCVYAPQISKALAGADRKDLMRRLPKFIYDEEKALERTRKILAEKIEQLNSAIDEVSAQLRADDPPNGNAVNSDEIKASI